MRRRLSTALTHTSRRTCARRPLGTFSEATASATVGAATTDASSAAAASISAAHGGDYPSLILGTMTFGWSKASRTVDDIEAWKMIRAFQQDGGSALHAVPSVPAPQAGRAADTV
jgi:hypothetical protein|eukprot:COSAG06_NODE_6665_length_2835_cov_2.151681_3_plen_115_part_00